VRGGKKEQPLDLAERPPITCQEVGGERCPKAGSLKGEGDGRKIELEKKVRKARLDGTRG